MTMTQAAAPGGDKDGAPASVDAPAENEGGAGAAGGAATGNGAADAENGVGEAAREDSYYGLAVEPSSAFGAAREATSQLHALLMQLKEGKEESVGVSRAIQLQLLMLRRAHRAMAKAAELGRSKEAAARKVADAEYAHVETRRYESACCRAAARRCRNYPTPSLTQIRPQLQGWSEEQEEEEESKDREEGAKAVSGLSEHLEAERVERERLARELEGLEKRKAECLEAFRETARQSSDLADRLKAVERALEPVCDLLETRSRPAGAASQPDAGTLEQLPAALRLIFSKFDTLAAFGTEGGVAVRVEIPAAAAGDGKPPPSKCPRVEAGAASIEASVAVLVEVSCPSSDGQAVKLRFESPHPSIVTAEAQGTAIGGLLGSLWPEDDGQSGALSSLLSTGKAQGPGRPYGWVQVLAGLRETTLAAVPALLEMDGVTASDVVLRVRGQMAQPNA
mmetsp:Transcript_9378/g.21454  ORF Transcript_9378/g.21454 Transcript_9378/m.21454 type:complete len:452 (+) Transcript_9378:134-1489(+)